MQRAPPGSCRLRRSNFEIANILGGGSTSQLRDWIHARSPRLIKVLHRSIACRMLQIARSSSTRWGWKLALAAGTYVSIRRLPKLNLQSGDTTYLWLPPSPNEGVDKRRLPPLLKAVFFLRFYLWWMTTPDTILYSNTNWQVFVACTQSMALIKASWWIYRIPLPRGCMVRCTFVPLRPNPQQNLREFPHHR